MFERERKRVKSLSVKITQDEYDYISKAAVMDDIPMSEIMLDALREWQVARELARKEEDSMGVFNRTKNPRFLGK